MEPKTLPHFWKRNMYQYHQFVSNLPGVTFSNPMLSQMDIFSSWYHVVQNWDKNGLSNSSSPGFLPLEIYAKKAQVPLLFGGVVSTAPSFCWWGKSQNRTANSYIFCALKQSQLSSSVSWDCLFPRKVHFSSDFSWAKYDSPLFQCLKTGPIFTGRISRSRFRGLSVGEKWSGKIHRPNQELQPPGFLFDNVYLSSTTNYVYIQYPYHPWEWYIYLHLVDFYGKCR